MVNMNLFELNKEEILGKAAPLAQRMRPANLDDIIGQEHILAKGKLLPTPYAPGRADGVRYNKMRK